jgi:hypothetical protein
VVETLVQNALGLGEWEMGGQMSAVRRGELLALLYGGIVYARGAPGHTDCYGTHRSDSPVRAL